MALYREDIVDIELESGSIHRTFLNHSIGKGDRMENRFGVRLFRNGEPVILTLASCQGFFMAPNGQNILISGTDKTGVDGNVAWVQLPQVCYDYEGNYTLAVKVIDPNVTGTMRIIDGTVDNTGVDNPVTAVADVPTYQEVLHAYEQAIAAAELVESLGFYLDENGYVCQRLAGEVE